MFIQNAWYPAAWSKDVPTGTIVPLRLLAQRLALFRDESGRVRALEDECPHRHAPLSLGRICQGQIECAYHGLRFDGEGACTRNPFAATIPPRARVRAFEAVEQTGIVWVWMGEGASHAQPPALELLDEATHFVAVDTLCIDASYLLAIDNILDLSHLEFLHPTTLGSPRLSQGTVEVSSGADWVRARTAATAEQVSKMLQVVFQLAADSSVDRVLDVRWSAPVTAVVNMSVRPTSEQTSERSISTAHFFTPATESTTRYLFAVGIHRSSAGYSTAAAALGLRALRHPFEKEDKVVLEAQQRALGSGQLRSSRVALPVDLASGYARRIIESAVSEEQVRGVAARSECSR